MSADGTDGGDATGTAEASATPAAVGEGESRYDREETVAGEARASVRLFAALLRKRAVLLARYPVDTLGAVAGAFGFFVLIFLGGRSVGGAAFDDSLGGLIVGYFVVTMAIAAYQSLAGSVTREAQWGTLEQLYMSPLGFGRVMVFQAVVNVLYSFLWGILILPLMLVVTGESLAVDLLTVAPLALFAVLSVMGVGFVFGGAAIVYKRVGNVFNLLQFGLIGLVAAPVESYPRLRYLPLVQGNAMLGRAMREGVPLWRFPLADVALLVGVGTGYFVAGFLVFRLFVRRARRAGSLGDY
ncbi:ABC transporter permease [Candidatus Halobonum tyrrellensis]|uniref:ABC transporter n=1 Tax=Candidatus Halobonum tyrrellensis G22 TaxID=1324957 RepID=V4HKS2_9EURY|nr:ABC transporter permease [Candidatus Halobonum tyrrellensis]ESP88524.1 hypothetical protein K933_08692 [Candidatus Halobonum tyrrellensis G22]